MNAMTVALIALACILSGMLLGLIIRSFLPAHHLNEAAKDVVKLGSGLIATLAALVLGLLISSAKGQLDSINAELTQQGAEIIMFDRVLADYGTETKDVREMLRSGLVNTIERIWPENKTGKVRMETFETSRSVESIQSKLRRLSPRNDAQRQLQSQALQLAARVAETRWVIIEQTQQTLPMAFLVMLIFWLTILFVGFGMLSPINATVLTVLFVCALSVSGAIFLILEMGSPFSGIVKVSSAPYQKALSNLGR